MKGKIKNFFGNKRNVITLAIITVIILVVILVIILFSGDNKGKFALNGIYDVFPEEVRELYTNMVSVSCSGDLYFDNVLLDEGAVKVSGIKDNTLLDYAFSYLDKNDKLDNKMDVSVLEDASEFLYNEKIKLSDKVKDYVYGDYIYNVDGDEITRKKGECSADVTYVSQLYGYSYNIDVLSIDVNIGYMKDGVLYDLANNRLGNYDGNVENLGDLFSASSYYRYNFGLDKKQYKLISVELNSKVS